jgi:hypothetical protein
VTAPGNRSLATNFSSFAAKTMPGARELGGGEHLVGVIDDSRGRIE